MSGQSRGGGGENQTGLVHHGAEVERWCDGGGSSLRLGMRLEELRNAVVSGAQH